MAAWAATGPNAPGSSARAWRTAAPRMGTDTGRRPSDASGAGAQQLGQPVGRDERDADEPGPAPHTVPTDPEASRRRVDTPTWLDGTTTVTGASGSAPLIREISTRSAVAASVPYRTQVPVADVMPPDHTEAV